MNTTRPRLLPALAAACFALLGAQLAAQPTPAQLDRLAELVEAGRIGPAKAGVELLLLEHPDDPRLREIARLLAARADTGPSPEDAKAIDAQFAEYETITVSAHRIRWVKARWAEHGARWRRAAEAGHPVAQLFVSLGSPEDAKTRLKWVERAADGGLAEARGHLGEYHLRRGLRSIHGELVKAKALFEAASAAGNPMGHTGLAMVCDLKAPAVSEPDRVTGLLQKAIALNWADAQREYGLYWGRRADQATDSSKPGGEFQEAERQERHWLQKAADQGDPKAQTELARLWYEGIGGPEDLVRARLWFQRAADQGNVLARDCLASMCENGEGGPVDLAKAQTLYEELARQFDDSGYRGSAERVKRARLAKP
jgi:TPR repeat protein